MMSESHGGQPPDFDRLMRDLRGPEGSDAHARAWSTVRDLIAMLVRARMSLEERATEESLDVAGSVLASFLEDFEADKLRFENEAALRAYLRRVVSNKLVDHSRRRRSEKRGGGVRPRPVGNDPEAGEVDPWKDPASLDRLLDQAATHQRMSVDLGQDERRLLELLSEGFNAREIADRLGIGHDAARRRVSRLRNKLRDLFGDEFGGEV